MDIAAQISLTREEMEQRRLEAAQAARAACCTSGALRGFAIFSEYGLEPVGDFAERGITSGGVEHERYQIFPGSRRLFQFLQALRYQFVVASSAKLAQAFDLG